MRLAAEPRKALLEKVRAHLRALAKQRSYAGVMGLVTADDAQMFVLLSGYKPTDLGNAAGSLFLTRDWVCVGRRKSTRESSHAREIKVWRLK